MSHLLRLNSSSHLPTCQFPRCPTSRGKFLFLSPYLPVPALEVPCHVVNSSPLNVPSPAVKFLFLSPCLPVPTLDVPSPVLNSSSHLPTCQFPRCPTSRGKFLFPSPYLPVPALEVPCHVVNSSPLDVPSPVLNSSSHLPTCQFPRCPTSRGKFLFLSPYLPVPALEVPCHVVNSSPLNVPSPAVKFLFLSPCLPVPTLDVPSPVLNSSSHLPTCQFPRCPTSRGKSSARLPTCQFRSWKSHVMW